MTLFHVFAGIGLIGITGYSGFLPFIQDDFSGARLKITTMLAALALGFVLFTGFLQLGSRHAVPQILIYKLSATALGGAVVLLGLFLRMQRIFNRLFFLVAMGSAFLLFSTSLYWGLKL
ncbi:MAG: hypothetical protein ABEK50_09660 [bacterium]